MENGLLTITLNEAFSYMVVFARFAGFFAFAPIFAERRINVRIRVVLTLLITLVVTPAVASTLPSADMNPVGFNLTILLQFLLGAFAAFIAQVLFSALDVAGSIVSFQMSLANAFVSSAATQQQTGLPALLFMMTATMLLLATDFHHVMILLVIEGFEIMPPKDLSFLTNMTGDFANTYGRFLSAAFVLALQLAAPIIILGLLMFLAAGVINRLVPGIQVFFILQPLQIFLGLLILMSGLSILMGYFIEDFGEKYQSLWNTR